MGENGLKYPEYQLLEAYLLHLEGEDDQASEILERYQNKSFHHNELELAGIICICVHRPGCTGIRNRPSARYRISRCRRKTALSF